MVVDLEFLVISQANNGKNLLKCLCIYLPFENLKDMSAFLVIVHFPVPLKFSVKNLDEKPETNMGTYLENS